MPQYTRLQVFVVWVLATAPMAAIAWWVVPWSLPPSAGTVMWAQGLVGGVTCGLMWQGMLVLLLVERERGDLRWATLRDALWLHQPRDPRTGRRGGRVWWVCLPLALLMGLAAWVPGPDAPTHRDLGQFLSSEAGQAFFRGNWPWFGLVLVLVTFNTVLGEELLFRGLLLPRMQAAFGRFDWLANGVLFALYHLHQPWVIPSVLLDVFVLAWPSKYYRSAWIGIVVHSAQSVLIAAVILELVLA
jgi:uncharacterized protein